MNLVPAQRLYHVERAIYDYLLPPPIPGIAETPGRRASSRTGLLARGTKPLSRRATRTYLRRYVPARSIQARRCLERKKPRTEPQCHKETRRFCLPGLGSRKRGLRLVYTGRQDERTDSSLPRYSTPRELNFSTLEVIVKIDFNELIID
jgi:hypothetical protein